MQLYPLIADVVFVFVGTQQRRKQAKEIAIIPISRRLILAEKGNTR